MQELIKNCKCSISLEINKHKDYYQTTKQAIDEINLIKENTIDIEMEKRMIEDDTIIILQYYPETPIGFRVIYGTSYKEVMDKANATD